MKQINKIYKNFEEVYYLRMDAINGRIKQINEGIEAYQEYQKSQRVQKILDILLAIQRYNPNCFSEKHANGKELKARLDATILKLKEKALLMEEKK